MLEQPVSKLFVRCAFALMLGASPALAAEQFITVLTGSASGVYYPLGVALASAVGKLMPQAKTSVQATKGAAENLNLLQAARGEVAFTLGDSLSDAWKGNGEAGFKTPLKKLRGIATLYPNYVQVVARADSGIRRLADLQGKRVSVGALKSPTELDARAIFAAAGLSYKAFARVEYLPLGESIELLKNRQIDAMLLSASLGISAIRDLAAAMEIVVVPIPPDVVKRTNDPAYLAGIIPARTYRGQDADLPAVVVENYLVTHAGVANDVVYNITKALWASLDQMAAAHAAAKAIDRRHPLEGMPVPLHPGAQRYYEEVGLLK
ncbi:MAG: TAXI family TRAP transporter solute-binding subunit [Casimicrobiaceae bacterium]